MANPMSDRARHSVGIVDDLLLAELQHRDVESFEPVEALLDSTQGAPIIGDDALDDDREPQRRTVEVDGGTIAPG